MRNRSEHSEGDRTPAFVPTGRESDWLAFLVEASTLLASSLDYDTTFTSVARLATRVLADICIVDVMDEDGHVRRLTTAHADPAREDLAAQLRRFPPDPAKTEGVPLVLRTGRPALFSTVDEQVMQAAAQSAEHLRLYRALEIRSGMIVPLVARDRILGALTFVASQPGRYTDDHLALARELAQIAAMAMDNAWLYRAAQRELEERRQVELGRIRREEELVTLLEHVPDLIMRYDRAGRCAFVNATMDALFGRPASEVIGRTPQEADAPPGVAEAWEAQIARVLDSGEDSVEELEVASPRGARWLQTRFVPELVNGHIVSVLAVGRDLSALRRAQEALLAREEQLRQAQKMEAIGRLAGGIAHDFNNLLTAIRSYAEFLLEALPIGTTPRADAEEIRRAADRAAALTRQLLAFSRKQVLHPQPVNLTTVVGGLEPMLARLLGEDIEIVVRAARGVPPVLADQGQIEQVLMNLAVNSRDAMPGGGVLMIETELARLDGRDPAQLWVRLIVRDTGMGMDEATMARMFEPFFTTKPPGEGTGLGLATVYGIVEQSGGHVDVQSQPGLGTEFSIYLPASDREVPDVPAPTPHPAGVPRSGTILLVEDEDGVRRLVRRVLEGAGYTVVEASSGTAAFTAAAAHRGEIDLLITDVIMPHMSGRVLADRLAAIRPGLKVLFMSGYTGDAMEQRGHLAPDARLLPKPFTLAQLSEAVDRAMKSR